MKAATVPNQPIAESISAEGLVNDEVPVATIPVIPLDSSSVNSTTLLKPEPSEPLIIKQAPTIVDQQAPRYPDRCHTRANAVEDVQIQITVDATGNVISPIIHSSTNQCFNRSALRAIKRWKYNPALENGRPVSSESLIVSMKFAKQ